ncbi:MAG TPA: hypothetical protein PKY81_05210, partial [bacterium]|nr:hypothetical protein [bacterium]HPN30336.1 hypothetical protein [bacterium]
MKKTFLKFVIIITFLNNLFLAAITAAEKDIFISEIAFIRHPIFNGSNNIKRIYKLANNLHFTTKISAIKKDLLFNIGDRFDTEIIMNSERNLRSRKYFYDADIKIEYINDSNVRAVVNTKEQWTTTIGLSFYKNEKGASSVKLVFKEHNLLGLGKELKIKKDIIDINENIQDYEYNDDNLLGIKNYILSLNYKQSQSSVEKNIKIGKRYYSDFDKYSFFFNNIKYDFWEEKDKIYNNFIESYISNGKLTDRIELGFRAHEFYNTYHCCPKKIYKSQGNSNCS